MDSSRYASRKEAILAAEEVMRARFGPGVGFEPVLPFSPFPRIFRVLDPKGQLLGTFRIFKIITGLEEWCRQDC
jgi:hypothetical protein